MKRDGTEARSPLKPLVRNCGWIRIQRIVDAKDGVLSVAEGMKNIPFEIKRVYYVYDLKYRDSHRGEHAHKKTEQVLFCLHGQVTLKLDDGFKRRKVVLDTPHLGVYMGPLVWVSMDRFIGDCILLVLASEEFRESDYIREYREFIDRVRRQHGPLR
jgi:WxcM-like, C-terminal